jgi:regulator of cell morphogenesis and NO signaling
MRTDVSIHPDMTVGTIAELFPTTVPVLTRHGLDLCCGGGRTLADVSRAHRLDLPQLIAELEAARAK